MAGHSHGGATAAGTQRGRLSVVLAITLTLFFLEVVGGLLAHSLVLLADAAHMAARPSRSLRAGIPVRASTATSG